MTTSVDPLRLARLAREAASLGLSPETLTHLRGLLIDALGANEPARRAEPMRGPERRSGPLKLKEEIHRVAQDDGKRAQDDGKRAQDVIKSKSDAKALEMRLRQLVEGDATWDQMAEVAEDLLNTRKDRETAARVLELAFLHAPNGALTDVLRHLRTNIPGFYAAVHASVRVHLCLRLWRQDGGELLAAILLEARDEPYLQPVECLLAFMTLAGAADATAPYMYFQRHRQTLLAAVKDHGPALKLTRGAFLLQVGNLALDLGNEEEGRALLAGIATTDAEHDEALRLLLDVSVERNKSGRSHYVELLMTQTDGNGRLRLLAEFFAATRGLGGFKDRNRPALNDLLKNPLSWVAEEPEQWAALSELLTAHRDLEPLLPQLFAVFNARALQFVTPVLDGALWQGPLGMKPDTPRDRFWHGVALLHQYVNCGTANEVALWRARDEIAVARHDWGQPLPYTWRELHKAATSWVAKNHYLMEADRTRMLQQLRVAVDTDLVAQLDVDDYLDHAESPPRAVLDNLQRLMAERGHAALESKIILKRAASAHLTNSDLDRLWHLACARQEHDLAWRVATVLKSRLALTPSVRHGWEISGEKRSQYPFVTDVAKNKSIVDALLKDFQPKAARLCYACLHVGPVLPELLAILEPRASASRPVAAPEDSVEAQTEKLLDSIKWLAAPKKRFRFPGDSGVQHSTLPAFMQVLPANPWSHLAARLCDRMGISAWNFKLSRLGAQIVDLIPRLASRQDLRRHSTKVAKWLKDLSPEQRASWQDLAALSRAMDDKTAADALAMFVCRLATVMLPGHLQALTSLQAMRADAAIIWDCERFILSDAYSDSRRRLGVAHRVPVPNALQRLTTIVQPESHNMAGTP